MMLNLNFRLHTHFSPSFFFKKNLKGHFFLPRTNNSYFYKHVMKTKFIHIKYIKKHIDELK